MPKNDLKPKVYWSPSRHWLAKQCLRRWAFKYRLGVPYEEDETIFHYGRLVHKYLETGIKPEEKEMLCGNKPFETMYNFQRHAELAEEYLKRIGTSDEDNAECEFALPLKYPSGRKPKYKIKIYGIIDRKLKDWRMIDYKTGAQKWSQTKLDTHDQFTFYMWASWCETGEMKDFFMLNFIRGNMEAGKEPDIQMRKVERHEDDFETLMDEVERLWRQTMVEESTEKCEGNHCFHCPFKEACENF